MNHEQILPMVLIIPHQRSGVSFSHDLIVQFFPNSQSFDSATWILQPVLEELSSPQRTNACVKAGRRGSRRSNSLSASPYSDNLLEREKKRARYRVSPKRRISPNTSQNSNRGQQSHSRNTHDMSGASCCWRRRAFRAHETEAK